MRHHIAGSSLDQISLCIAHSDTSFLLELSKSQKEMPEFLKEKTRSATLSHGSLHCAPPLNKLWQRVVAVETSFIKSLG